MKTDGEELRGLGKAAGQQAAHINGRTIVVTGKWLRTAVVKDEEVIQGEIIGNPESFIAQLRQTGLGADLFEFAQSPLDGQPRYGYHMEWDNAAMVRIKSYSDWWDSLPQETRRNVKKAVKQGVSVRSVTFDDELLQGIVEIYNESPFRQGKRFRHYGKRPELIKEETGTFLDRSEFIGAYHAGQLIGFAKLVYVDQSARIIHIVSMKTHAEKRPSNALIAKAVEICAEKGLPHLFYCKYIYDKFEKSPLTEFKRRNGFNELRYPCYYVPLTWKGKLALRLGLHHGPSRLIPQGLKSMLLGFRRKFLEVLDRRELASAKIQ